MVFVEKGKLVCVFLVFLVFVCEREGKKKEKLWDGMRRDFRI